MDFNRDSFYISNLLSETAKGEFLDSARRTKHINKYVAERYTVYKPQLAVESWIGDIK